MAIVFTTALAMVLIATGETEDLASTTVTLLLFAFIFVNVAVLLLRRERVDHDHFTVPRALPVLAVLTSAGLLTQRDGEGLPAGGGLPVARARPMAFQPPGQGRRARRCARGPRIGRDD